MKWTIRALLCVSLALVMLSSGLAIMQKNAAATEGAVPVSSGTSVTIWEQTGSVQPSTFSIAELTAPSEGMIYTSALEEYHISTDGTYLNIKCNRWYTPEPDPHPWRTVGNNIVAVQLNGVEGHPDGLWAGYVVSYQVGDWGTEASVVNALGPLDHVGPFGNSVATLMGDSWSEMTLGFLANQQLPVPPVAKAGPDQLVKDGTMVVLDGSISVASPDSLYLWSFMDSSGQTILLSGDRVVYILTGGGPHMVTLSIFDLYGQSSTDTVTVTVCPYIGHIEMGQDHSLVVGYSAPSDMTWSAWIFNSGLKSLTIVVTDMSVPHSKPITIKVSFVTSGAYPSGDMKTDPITMLGGHSYSVNYKDLQGLNRGYTNLRGYADIWGICLPA